MKNFLAVLAGLVFTIAVSTGIDVAMHATGIFPEEVSGMATSDWILATSYRLVAAIGGGWMASPKLGPLWYPLLLVVTALPCTWLGGKLSKR